MTADVQRELAEALRAHRDGATTPGDREQDYRPGAPCMDCGDYPGPRHEDSDCPRAVSRALLPTVQALIADAEKLAAAQAIDVAHLEHQREWSLETFGPGDRRKGVIDHIRKELVEIEAADEHTDEWIDVVILALDGAWRDGYEPTEIIAAIKAKQAKNECRTWPDWRTSDPDKAIEHDRALDPS